MRKGSETRERILEIAETAELAKGFGATSIEELIAEAGITKSGFFYHFKDKNELAHGLLERYIASTDKLFADVFGRAKELSDDPLQSFLIGLKLFAEEMAALPNGHPGCLVATMSYQDRLFSREIRDLVTRTVADCNRFFRAALEEIVAAYPPHEPVDIDKLSRMIVCAIVMSRTLRRPEVLPEQILIVRSHIKMQFSTPVVFRVAA